MKTRTTRQRVALLGTTLAVAVALAVPGAALASTLQPTVVQQNAVDSTPQVVSTTGVPNPHVDAIAVLGNQTFAGGDFDTITPSFARSDIVSFNSATGAVSTTFNPRLDGGQVWSIATDPATNSVYVAGEFRSVNGVTRPPLVKLDAQTGAVDTTFKPPFRLGRVTDVQLVTIGGAKRLVVASNVGKRLFSLNPSTGGDDGYINSTITDAIPGAWGTVAVYHFAVNPAKTKLVATGNFQTVDAAPGTTMNRKRFFMLDLGPTGATLRDWYYPGFALPCSSTAPRRIAYLQGIDWSPDGSAFDVTATGQVPLHKSEIWGGDQQSAPYTTVCDAVGRFALANDQAPVWINYTGGDSVWVVSDTGSAVYVQGHFKWLDNPNGLASQCPTGDPCASRRGIGAINPVGGKTLTWNPGVTSKTGGKALLATVNGLWVGDDSTRFGTETHYGIAFAPL